MEKAIFAGGCFWCMVHPFDQWPGVLSVVSGYTGGHTENPTYEEVSSHTTGHREAVEITFDPKVMPYAKLLELFWQQIDPTDAGGQFVDRGSSYQAAVYYVNEIQRAEALDSRAQLSASGRFDRPIVTEILPADTFYPAEDYHQDFYRQSPGHYNRYRIGSGRDRFLHRHWDD